MITRRDFIKSSAIAAALLAAGCAAPAPGNNNQGEVAETDTWVKGVCRYCGTGCGVLTGVKDGKIVSVKGDPDNPVNRGALCLKGLTLPEIMYTDDRLLTPLIRRDGNLVQATWEEALDLIAEKINTAVTSAGPGAVGFYGSGQNVAEEAYIANKLFKGCLGTNNIDGNPRTCMASAVAGYTSTFGKDEPCGTYDDIEDADVFLIIGANPAEAHPILYQRIANRKEDNPDVQVIVLDPRRTQTAEIADHLLQFIPGTDLSLLNSIAHVLIEEDLIDPEFIAAHCNFQQGDDAKTFADYAAFVAGFAPELVSDFVGVSAEDIRTVARIFGEKGKNSMSLWTMGLNQRTRGTFLNNQMHNLHLITGKICKPGNTPFSLTGQPSACGSIREVGALSHLLPAHRLVANEEHRQQIAAIWGTDPAKMSPTPGYATIELFQAAGTGAIQVLWVVCTNPGQSLPNLAAHRAAMEKTFLIVSEAYHPTHTSELADVVLPSALWMEKEGIYGNGERRTQYIGKAVEPPGEARPDVWQLQEVAKRLGFADLFTYADNEAIWEEYRLCTTGTKMDLPSYQRLQASTGLLWPVPTEEWEGTRIRYAAPYDPFVESGVNFYGKPDGKAVVFLRPQVDPQELPDAEYPFYFSTGRVLEHWHTNTMTGKVPALVRAMPEMYVEIHPADAAELSIADGEYVKVVSRRGECRLMAKIDGRGQPRQGMLWSAFHDQETSRMVNFLTGDAVDPTSKQPEYKICACRVEKG
jgi:nitrate reductase NapA